MPPIHIDVDDVAVVVAGGDRDLRGRDRGGEGEGGCTQTQRTYRRIRATALKLKKKIFFEKKCFKYFKMSIRKLRTKW